MSVDLSAWLKTAPIDGPRYITHVSVQMVGGAQLEIRPVAPRVEWQIQHTCTIEHGIAFLREKRLGWFQLESRLVESGDRLELSFEECVEYAPGKWVIPTP